MPDPVAEPAPPVVETCPKCAGKVTRTIYHAVGCERDGCDCVSCTRDSHNKRRDEHLHIICQGCFYDWTVDTRG